MMILKLQRKVLLAKKDRVRSIKNVINKIIENKILTGIDESM